MDVSPTRGSRSDEHGNAARQTWDNSDSGEFSDVLFDGEDDGESLRPPPPPSPGPTMVQLPKHKNRPLAATAAAPPTLTHDAFIEDIDAEFLKELPPELQQEILLEHAAAQKRANDAAIQQAMLQDGVSGQVTPDRSRSDYEDELRDNRSSEESGWVCHVCTFANHPAIQACEMCETPHADVAGYYGDDADWQHVDGASSRSRSSSGGEGYSKLALRIQSSVFSSSLKKIRMPATPATTSMTQKDDPTAEDLLIAATMKIQQLQTSASQGVQSLMAKASASRRASPSPSALSPSSSGNTRPSPQAAALLKSLQQDLNTKCEPGDELYETLLQRLWLAIYQDAPRSPRKTGARPLAHRAFERVSEGWVDIGFQGPNPDTDFRGGGLLALKCLVYAFEAYPLEMLEIVMTQKPSDEGTQWYPVCCAGINLTCMIAGLLRLGNGNFATTDASFWTLFEEPSAFYQLYFHAFVRMDAAWHRLDASYMEFGVVLKATRRMVTHMLDQAPQTLPQLSAAADKTTIDRFVVTASKAYLDDTENGECPDPFHLLDDEDEVLVPSPRSTISSVISKLTGGMLAPAASTSHSTT